MKIQSETIGNELKGGVFCSKCYKEEITPVIKILNHFRKSEDFNNKNELIKKQLWFSEEMACWHDLIIPIGNGIDETTHQESVSDYMDKTIKELQLLILDELLLVVGDETINLYKNPEFEFLDLKRQFKVISDKK